ncbi:ABC transporter permease [Geminicoccus roseus]|uniref:ABC transporter permease n=1 Tax=Geminicoccus roseus TaxID=404900 RepID=UPI0004204AD5|nr:ABC transporter permease [Geminicoccus roseus]
MIGRILHAVLVTGAVLFLLAPILAVIPLAFNSGSFLSYPLDGLSLRWFAVLLETPPWMMALGNSVKIALGAMAISLLLGGLAAVGLHAVPAAWRIVVGALFVSPLVVPSVVLAVGLFFLFARAGLAGHPLSIMLAHALLGFPLVFVSVASTLRGIDPNLEMAAQSMGASRWYRFWAVTFPLALPGFWTGAIFAFMTSFDEVIIALFLSSPESTTLPVVLFGSLRDKLQPTIVAVAVVLTFTSALFLAALGWLGRPRRAAPLNATETR